MKITEDAIRERTQQLADTKRSQLRGTIRDDTPMDDMPALVVTALRAVAQLQLQMEALLEIPAIQAVLKDRNHGVFEP